MTRPPSPLKGFGAAGPSPLRGFGGASPHGFSSVQRFGGASPHGFQLRTGFYDTSSTHQAQIWGGTYRSPVFRCRDPFRRAGV